MGSRGGVEYTLAGDSREVVNALKKIGDQADRTERKLAEMSRKSDEGSRKAKQGYDQQGQSVRSLTSGLGKYLAGLASVSTAVSLIAAEWRNVTERQKEAAQANVQFGDAIAQTIRNLGGFLGKGARSRSGSARRPGRSTSTPRSSPRC